MTSQLVIICTVFNYYFLTILEIEKIMVLAKQY